MSIILMYVGNALILFSFLGYLILIILNNKYKNKIDGFNLTKDILAEYNQINIIENKNIFTIYNLKRKVIKLASKCYYGNSVSNLGISLMEAGVSAIDNKNKYLNIFRNIISNLKYLYILPIIAIFLNNITFSIGDARIAIIILIIFSIISYMLIEIKDEAYNWLCNNIKKIKNINQENVLSFVSKIVLIDKFIFFGELIMICRFILILFDIN